MFVSSLDEPDKVSAVHCHSLALSIMKGFAQHSGCTAVMMAASREQLPALRWLVDQGADWKRRSEVCVALCFCSLSCRQCVWLLQKGRTALMQAVLWGARGCAKYLVELGADLKQRDNVRLLHAA